MQHETATLHAVDLLQALGERSSVRRLGGESAACGVRRTLDKSRGLAVVECIPYSAGVEKRLGFTPSEATAYGGGG